MTPIGYGFNISSGNGGSGVQLSSYTPASLIYVATATDPATQMPIKILNWVSLASGPTPTPLQLSSFSVPAPQVGAHGVCPESDIYGTIYDPTTEFVIVGDHTENAGNGACVATDPFWLVTSPPPRL